MKRNDLGRQTGSGDEVAYDVRRLSTLSSNRVGVEAAAAAGSVPEEDGVESAGHDLSYYHANAEVHQLYYDLEDDDDDDEEDDPLRAAALTPLAAETETVGPQSVAPFDEALEDSFDEVLRRNNNREHLGNFGVGHADRCDFRRSTVSGTPRVHDYTSSHHRGKDSIHTMGTPKSSGSSRRDADAQPNAGKHPSGNRDAAGMATAARRSSWSTPDAESKPPTATSTTGSTSINLSDSVNQDVLLSRYVRERRRARQLQQQQQ